MIASIVIWIVIFALLLLIGAALGWLGVAELVVVFVVSLALSGLVIRLRRAR